MDTVKLGRTNITVSKNAFGALPIQRIPKEEAARLLHMALDAGMTFIDTARAYSDSEEKIGYAISDRRNGFYLSTKAARFTVEAFWEDLHTSLRNLKTDHVDIYQFHNPAFCPKPDDGTGLYEAMLEAKRQGKIRFIGITNHRLSVAEEALRSGLYDTLQFPFCYLSGKPEEALVALAKELDVGFLGMKALSGGLITHSDAAYAFLADYDNVLPLWGVQKEEELREFISYQTNPPRMNDEFAALIEADRKMLAGDFCRGCGYCMPCPMDIQINDAARMSLLLRRAPYAQFLTPEWQEKMAKIKDCIHCGQCLSKCPYGLDTPAVLRRNLEDYEQFSKDHS